MVAAPALKRTLWLLLTVAAVAVLVGLSLHGERKSMLVPPRPKGVAQALPLDQISRVDVSVGDLHWRFEREGQGAWRATSADRAVASDFAVRLDTALKLLHRSSPEDHIAVDFSNAAQTAQFGLAPPAMTVTVADADMAITVSFGARNPLGLANYVRVGNASELLLLPSYVLDTLQSVVASG